MYTDKLTEQSLSNRGDVIRIQTKEVFQDTKWRFICNYAFKTELFIATHRVSHIIILKQAYNTKHVTTLKKIEIPSHHDYKSQFKVHFCWSKTEV